MSTDQKRNEFRDDWAEAPVRSGLIPEQKLKNRTVLVAGDDEALTEAVADSFESWNRMKNLGIRIIRSGMTGFAEADRAAETGDNMSGDAYVILTGACCGKAPEDAVRMLEKLENWKKGIKEVLDQVRPGRILLLSDGRVYGRLPSEFAASEYEAGATDPANPCFFAQYYLQSLEKIFLDLCRERNTAFEILRTGLLYGACFQPELKHPVYRLAGLVAAGEQADLSMRSSRISYASLHDALTAIQFLLMVCPENKILNMSGLSSDATEAEMVMHLFRNFPSDCKISLHWEEGAEGPEGPEGALLNTQLVSFYGFEPRISLEDGLIILVKSLQAQSGVFIFDNTYKGKLPHVQQILLGYLLEIDRICRKHNIRYFLAGGTLLGAIRHQGFIPWDDDADVMMLREDFDRFMEVAKEELPSNIFVQPSATESSNHNAFTKLRINNTLFATEFTAKFPQMHNGIFFDVLAHDRTGNHGWSRKLHLMGTMLSRSLVFNKWGNTNIKSGGSHPVICRIVDYAKYLVPMRLAEWMQERSYRFFQHRNTGWLYDGMGRNLKRGAFPREWLEETVYVPFEGCMLPVPKEYDKYLTWLYGDYMKMIPVSSRRTSHSIVLMDLGAYGNYRAPEQKQED